MKKVCSFCGRGEKEVRLLITGLNGFICEDCTTQAYQIVQSAIPAAGDVSAKGDDDGNFNIKKVPKPKDIKSYLDEYIIGQDEAKRFLRWQSTTITSVCNSRRMTVVWRLRRAT